LVDAVWLLLSLGLLVGQTPAHVHTTNAPPQLLSELSRLVDKGQLASAKSRVEEGLRRYPSDAALHNIAGAIDAQQGAYGAAERHFRTAIAADPGITPAYLNLGRLYQEHAREDPEALQKAFAVYEQLLVVDKDNDEALFQAAYLSASAGQWASSRAFLERLPRASRSRPQALATLAVDLAALGDGAGAANLTARLIAHPDLVEEDVLAVVPALERLRDHKFAESLFAGLDTRGLASAPSLRQLGIAISNQERFEAARQVLERAMSAAGAASVPALLDLADVAYRQGDYRGALSYLAHARDLDPQNAQIHFFFGISCIELNLGGEAYDSLKTAVALAPDNPYVNFAFGAVAIHRREPSEALPYFERYVRLKPDDPRGRFALGAARFYSNDFDAARIDLEQAARSPATAAGAHYFLARIARQSNDLGRAREEIQRALEANPRYPDALAELGLLQTRNGEFRSAERSLQDALASEPDNYAATFNLAALYARTRDPRQQEQAERLAALQQKRAVTAQEFLRIVEVVRP
jgi:tetratricopeptide (TPR) repeat protein